MGLSNGLKQEREALFSRKFICVSKQDFYIKRQLSYKSIFCKKTAFLHKKIRFFTKIYFCKRQFFFYNRSICKKAEFLHQKAAFLQKIYFGKKRSYSKCCWRIQLVFILKLFSLYKCFLAYFTVLFISNACHQSLLFSPSLLLFFKPKIVFFYTTYKIYTSVLLENIPLVKFIKTTSGTRVVYFP